MTGPAKAVTKRLVVVAIILIIVGIAIPRLLSARTAAIETAAGSTMRTANTALMSFNSKFGQWPVALANLGGTNCDTAAATTTAGCFLDNNVAINMVTPGVGQYVFTYNVTGGAFTLSADPIASSSAHRHFYSDTNLTVHFNDTAAAGPTDPSLGNN